MGHQRSLGNVGGLGNIGSVGNLGGMGNLGGLGHKQHPRIQRRLGNFRGLGYWDFVFVGLNRYAHRGELDKEYLVLRRAQNSAPSSEQTTLAVGGVAGTHGDPNTARRGLSSG